MIKIITIDGPAGSGKEKISKYIAKKFNFYHIDSGLLYRNLAYDMFLEKIKINKKKEVQKFIGKKNKISLNKDKNTRKEVVGVIASKIAKYDFVRNFVNYQQKKTTKTIKNYKGFVIDGRDIGSVVFKKAILKLYVDVDINIRAKRRFKQLIDAGEKSIYPQILKDIKLRDKKDKSRKNSPLVIPNGAIIINNSASFRSTTNQIMKATKGII